MTPLNEKLARWLYETTPRQSDVGRFAWDYFPNEGKTGKHAYIAWADALLASEEWQAREVVISKVKRLLGPEEVSAEQFAADLSRVGTALARLAAVRGETP